MRVTDELRSFKTSAHSLSSTVNPSMTEARPLTLHKQIASLSVSESMYPLQCFITDVDLDLFTCYAEHPCSFSRNRSILGNPSPAEEEEKKSGQCRSERLNHDGLMT